MKKSETWRLAAIVVVAAAAAYIVIDGPKPGWVHSLAFWQPESQRRIDTRLGLDLQGGLQVLLAADVPDGQALDRTSMEAARRIVENRVNSLGLTEPVVQAQGERRIIVELPGIDNPEQAVETLKSTALLEFVHVGYSPLWPGTLVTTSLGGPSDGRTLQEDTDSAGPEPAGEAALAPSSETSPTVPSSTEVLPVVTAESTATVATVTSADQPASDQQSAPQAYETLLTGADIRNVQLDPQQGQYVIPFQLNEQGTAVFAEYTSSHVGQYLCIVMDKTVLSCPSIAESIPNGEASISGAFTYETARQLAIQLRHGALPVPLRIETFNRIGATLGAESVATSVRAGAVGLAVVLLFMLVYYRLPGVLADIALVIYVLVNVALYKLVPITLTLPGIAGFLLSSGMAVDANILIFERMKEELRGGRRLGSAIDVGFQRAWPSIRDGQLSTLIVCAILFFFGTNFGASIVKGFAITLAIGTVVNVFTAVVATRTFMRQVAVFLGDWLAGRSALLGV
jgi:protein-export membrane protein SecD